MGENDPERETRRMRDPESLRDQNQFAAVDQRDRRSERPAIKEKRNKKHRAGAEQLCRGGRNCRSIHLSVRL